MLRQCYTEGGGDDEGDDIDWGHTRNGREVNRVAVLSQWRDLPLCKLVAVTWGGVRATALDGVASNRLRK